MKYFVIMFVLGSLYWWYHMTNPNNPEFPNSWNPSDGPESEDELGDK